METKKIYPALVAIMKATKAIGKERRNQSQNFMFRGIDDVMNSLHDIFADNGVFILPEVLDYSIATETTGRGTKMFYTRAKIKHHFIAEDGSEASVINVGEAMDTGDKGMNKAMSVALKYALMQMLLIPTEDDKDPDATSHDELRAADAKAALAEIASAQSRDELVKVWDKYGKLDPSLTVSGTEFYNAWCKRNGEVPQ